MFQLEYTTFARARLLGCSDGECPIPRERLPQASLRATSTITPRRAPYGMPDLTVGSWLALARRLGDSEEKTLRDLFGSFMRVSEAPV
jgi:endopolyphosphatase